MFTFEIDTENAIVVCTTAASEDSLSKASAGETTSEDLNFN
jgi:hypothetical protein